MKTQKYFSTQQMVLMAVLIAMNIILSRFFSLAVWNMKIGFAFVPVVLAAIYLGKWQAAIVAGIGDLLGAIMFPIAAYFPGFTLTAFFVGFVYGHFLHKQRNMKQILIAIFITEVVGSLLLNTLWISILFGSPFVPIMMTRVLQVLVMGIVEYLVIQSMVKVFAKA